MKSLNYFLELNIIMLKQSIALILFLAIIVWVYVTIKINQSFGGVEGFSGMEPTTTDNMYLKKLNSELLNRPVM